jgi:signal transduction histidine kinase
MIALPLVKINKVATKMAQLDFTEKCEAANQDEIGNVAASLNFLSENLDNALTSLKQANAKLEEDIEKERKLEKMRREFVASVSHELKTPISLIDGYAVGLKDNIFEGEDRDYYLDIIIDESEKMANLVSDMLDLSYLESGSFKLKREVFNLTELIKHTLKKYGNMFEEKKAILKLNLLEGVTINADWNRLEQVLTNFITNALRHVNEDGTIYVNMIEKEDSFSIEVENTGSLISEEDLIKIWDKFYKVDKARTRKLGGTGIGLSIVKNILVHHGYSFGTENTDRGVKFYFVVPSIKDQPNTKNQTNTQN